MKKFNPFWFMFVALAVTMALPACAIRYANPDPLPSWNDGAAKARITGFVTLVTDSGNSAYVPPQQRIATFDNDGTLWSEKPTYFQLLFILDRIKSMAPDYPEWQVTQPFKAVLENDMAALHAAGEHGLVQLSMTALSGMTSEEFGTLVSDWMAAARHPVTGQPYTSMVFQPMLELLDYLRANGFKVFIVSGGGLAFMRPWVEPVYGVPPDQVVGSSLEMRYELRDGEPVIVRLPEMHFIDDKAGKPVGIRRFIGQRPIMAVGNSDGDFEMLEWTTSGAGERLGILVHHTDAEREWAYDRDSSEGRLDRGLDAAGRNGWLVIDMARDWNRIYPWHGLE